MHRSFIDKKLLDFFLEGQEKTLPDEIIFRFNNILRVKNAEKVAIFDGEGRQASGLWNPLLQKIEEIELTIQTRLSPCITLLQACSDEAKISDITKRATEFGVDKIIFFNADYSQQYTWAKILKKTERLRQIAIDASRQSGRFFIPELVFKEDLANSIKINDKTIGFFGLLDTKNLLSENITHAAPLDEFIIVVGPEGGLSPAEAQSCKKNGLVGVKWSPFTIRSEAAGLCAISIINAFLKRG